MDKRFLRRILVDTSKELDSLIKTLEDDSVLRAPDDYDCSKCINDLIFHLKQGKRYSGSADTEPTLSEAGVFSVAH